MTRRTLDIALPLLYALAIVVAVLVGGGKTVAVVAVVGGILLGMYYAALRRNLRV